jgi:hypothetical protein
MLYPLSYEGLPCTFAQHAGLGSGRWSWVATSLPTACAAPVPRAVWPGFKHRLGTWRRLYGGWCRVKNRRSGCGAAPPAALSHVPRVIDSEKCPWRGARPVVTFSDDV